jgi:hypothetical protein
MTPGSDVLVAEGIDGEDQTFPVVVNCRAQRSRVADASRENVTMKSARWEENWISSMYD